MKVGHWQQRPARLSTSRSRQLHSCRVSLRPGLDLYRPLPQDREDPNKTLHGFNQWPVQPADFKPVYEQCTRRAPFSPALIHMIINNHHKPG